MNRADIRRVQQAKLKISNWIESPKFKRNIEMWCHIKKRQE